MAPPPRILGLLEKAQRVADTLVTVATGEAVSAADAASAAAYIAEQGLWASSVRRNALAAAGSSNAAKEATERLELVRERVSAFLVTTTRNVPRMQQASSALATAENAAKGADTARCEFYGTRYELAGELRGGGGAQGRMGVLHTGS